MSRIIKIGETLQARVSDDFVQLAYLDDDGNDEATFTIYKQEFEEIVEKIYKEKGSSCQYGHTIKRESTHCLDCGEYTNK